MSKSSAKNYAAGTGAENVAGNALIAAQGAGTYARILLLSLVPSAAVTVTIKSGTTTIAIDVPASGAIYSLPGGIFDSEVNATVVFDVGSGGSCSVNAWFDSITG